MHPNCHACGMEKKPLAMGINICPRCDTSAQTGGMRVGPPNAPGTTNGWFRATFGDKK